MEINDESFVIDGAQAAVPDADEMFVRQLRESSRHIEPTLDLSQEPLQSRGDTWIGRAYDKLSFIKGWMVYVFLSLAALVILQTYFEARLSSFLASWAGDLWSQIAYSVTR
jgi:hypothetical protein